VTAVVAGTLLNGWHLIWTSMFPVWYNDNQKLCGTHKAKNDL